MVWIVLLAVIVLEGILIMQPANPARTRRTSISGNLGLRNHKSAYAHRAASGKSFPDSGSCYCG